MATAGPFVQQVLHETGLAVFDKLGVPIWADERMQQIISPHF